MQVLVSRRPPRDKVPPMTVHPRWPDRPFPKDKVRRFAPDTLVEFALECQQACGTIQANVGRWSGEVESARGDESP